MDKFIVGERTPQWFDSQVSMGRARVNYDGKNISNIVIYTPTGTSVAFVGDVIAMTQSGMVVIPAKKAVQYKLRNDNFKRRK